MLTCTHETTIACAYNEKMCLHTNNKKIIIPLFLHVDNISITCFDVDHSFRFWNGRPTPCKFWRNRALTCPRGVAIAVCGASLIPYLEYSVESSTSSPDADIVFTDFFASVRLFFSIQSESKKGVPKAKSHMIKIHTRYFLCVHLTHHLAFPACFQSR